MIQIMPIKSDRPRTTAAMDRGRKIKAARKAAGFKSAKSLADAMEVERETVAQWEDGRIKTISPRNIKNLIKLLPGLTVEDLDITDELDGYILYKYIDYEKVKTLLPDAGIDNDAHALAMRLAESTIQEGNFKLTLDERSQLIASIYMDIKDGVNPTKAYLLRFIRQTFTRDNNNEQKP